MLYELGHKERNAAVIMILNSPMKGSDAPMVMKLMDILQHPVNLKKKVEGKKKEG